MGATENAVADEGVNVVILAPGLSDCKDALRREDVSATRREDAMCSLRFRRRLAAVSLVVIGALLWQGAEPAAAQVRPDAPGSMPVVRLDEPRITPLPEAEMDGRAACARG